MAKLNRKAKNIVNQEIPASDQRVHIDGATIKGQVGQAGGNLHQFQFIFARQRQRILDKRDRQALLDKVRNFWIKGVLEQIPSYISCKKLELEERLDILEQTWKMVYETPEQLRQTLPSGTRIIDLFIQLGEGATLLILGEATIINTHLLLELTRDLISHATSNNEAPLPVVFKLASWRGGKQPIATWLIQELQKSYRLPKKLSKKLVEEEKLLLLLDGLNEIHTDQQENCIQAINQFIKNYGRTGIVVCSQAQEYLRLSKRLKFQHAICIREFNH